MNEKQGNLIYKMSPNRYAPRVGRIGPAGKMNIFFLLLRPFIMDVCLLKAM